MGKRDVILGGAIALSLAANVLTLVKVASLEDALRERPQAPPNPAAPAEPVGQAEQLKLLREEIASLETRLSRPEPAAPGPQTQPRAEAPAAPAPAGESEVERKARVLAGSHEQLEAFFKDLESLRDLESSLSAEERDALVAEKTARLLGLSPAEKARILEIVGAIGQSSRRAVTGIEAVFKDHGAKEKTIAQQYDKNRESPQLDADVKALEGTLYDDWHRWDKEASEAKEAAVASLAAALPENDRTRVFLEKVKHGWWVNSITAPQPWLPYAHDPREKWVADNAGRWLSDFRKKEGE